MPDEPPKLPGASGAGGVDLNDPLIQAYLARQAGAGNSIAASPSQPFIAIPDPKAPDGSGIRWVPNQNYGKAPASSSTPTRTATVNVPGVGVYSYDPTQPGAGFTLGPTALPPNQDEEMSKALDRFTREKEFAAKQKNLDAGFGWATDEELFKRKLEGDQLGLSQDELKLRYKTFDEQQRQFDIKQRAQDLKDAQDIAQSKAQTGYVGAQTTKLGQEMDIAAQLLPGQLAQQQATLAGTQASTAAAQQAAQIAGAPQAPQALPQGPYTYTRDPLTGQTTLQMNPAYVPKTQAEIAARVGQINALAQAKSREVLGKVGTNGYTAEDSVRDFNGWYEQNVQPQLQALDAAQQDAQFQRTKDEAAMRTAAMTTALGAGNQAISAFSGMQNGRVGPNFEAASAAASRGDFKGLGDIQGATGYQAPDLTELARQQTMEALKYISPTAAQATGSPMPNYSAINIPDYLNRNQYLPGGAPLPAAVGPPVPLPEPPPWQRADQMYGTTPPGNAMAAPGLAGTVPIGSPQYLSFDPRQAFGTYSWPA